MRTALLGLAALGLAACGGSETPKPTADAPPGAETPAGPAAAPETPVAPAGLTGPAAGKWKMTMTSSTGMAMPGQEYCYEKQISLEEAQAMQQQAGVTCTEQSFTPVAGGFTGHSVCKIESMTMTTDQKITGDFNTKYTIEGTTSIDPAPPGMPNPTTTTITMERLGDCTP
jgi:hypothetical protein